MKLLLPTLWAALALSVCAETNVLTKVRVTGDRVNIRTRPTTDSESLEPAMRGEELVYLDATNGWVAVQPPDYIDCWVAAQFIEGGVVIPKKLNVRAGPSLNYSVVTILQQGDAVESRGEFNEWLKIAPPGGSRVWISEQFVEVIEPPKPEPEVVPEVEPEPEVVPEAEPEPAVVEPQKEQEEELPPLVLTVDPTKPQGKFTEMPGVLRRANPGLYKLVLIAGDIEEPICLVRGKERQLEKLLNRSLLIKGKLYWAKGVDLPVINAEVIHLDPILAP
jgi:hypothetical protein